MMEQKWPITVIVTDCDIRRISVDQKPSNHGSLLAHLKVKLALPYGFRLQFEDPLFNNAFCNLTDVSELSDRATLKIISLESLSLVSSTLSSLSTSDTEILYTSEEKSQLMRPDPWPPAFDIPEFSVDVNFRLRQGDLAYMKDGTRMDLSRDMKRDLRKTCRDDVQVQSIPHRGTLLRSGLCTDCKTSLSERSWITHWILWMEEQH